MSYIEYDPSVNSNSLFHVEADILNLLLLYDSIYIFPYLVYTNIC